MAFIKVVTDYGIQKQQRCIFSSEDLDIAYLVLGDANGSPYVPNANQTGLVNEIKRVPIQNLRVKNGNANSWIFDVLVTEVEENTHFYEVGILDSEEKLLFLSQCDFIMTTSLDGIPSQTKVSGTFVLQQGLSAVVVNPATVIATEESVAQNYADRNFSNLLPPAQAKFDAKAAGVDLTAHIENLANPHSVTKAQVGLGNAMQSALNLKVNTTDLMAALLLKADKTTLHALKGYSDEGELLTDTEGLADVKRYAHSTFDPSKFTVVGSPNITDDGIASGSTNNEVRHNFDFSNAKEKIEIFARVFFDPIESSDLQYTWSLNWVNDSNNNYMIYKFRNATNYISLTGFGGDFRESQLGYNPLGKWLDVHITAFSDNTFESTVMNVETGQKYTKTGTSNYFQSVVAQNSTHFTCFRNSTATQNTQTDLKYFSVKVDGVEVFSGNKTGIDTIKPDNYTVVGTPTIRADGVASGFSNSNYIRILF